MKGTRALSAKTWQRVTQALPQQETLTREEFIALI
jgi:hypothetical protein